MPGEGLAACLRQGSDEGSLNAVKASASGAECLPAWAAAQSTAMQHI